jgi:hypothetical protein
MTDADKATITSLIQCLTAHEPSARVLGNVQAGDAAQALTALLKSATDAKRKADNNPIRIVIHVEGGQVQRVVADRPGVEVLVADFDVPTVDDGKPIGVVTMTPQEWCRDPDPFYPDLQTPTIHEPCVAAMFEAARNDPDPGASQWVREVINSANNQ